MSDESTRRIDQLERVFNELQERVDNGGLKVAGETVWLIQVGDSDKAAVMLGIPALVKEMRRMRAALEWVQENYRRDVPEEEQWGYTDVLRAALGDAPAADPPSCYRLVIDRYAFGRSGAEGVEFAVQFYTGDCRKQYLPAPRRLSTLDEAEAFARELMGRIEDQHERERTK